MIRRAPSFLYLEECARAHPGQAELYSAKVLLPSSSHGIFCTKITSSEIRALGRALFSKDFFAEFQLQYFSFKIHNQWDSNPWPPYCVSLSLTSAPYCHLCSYCISIPHILYQTTCELIVWGPKWFQIKKLSTTRFHNFLDIYNFLYGVSPSWCRLQNLNFKFEKFKRSFCITRWFQIKKLSTTKFHNFFRYTKFI